MDFHLANLVEIHADAFPEKVASITCHPDGTDITRTWREFDERASRIAALLRNAGLGIQAKFGIYMRNRGEYLETHSGGFKARTIPINVNFRYEADELVYLLNNSDSEAVFFQGEFSERIAKIRSRLPDIKLYVQVDDGSGPAPDWALDYETAIADVAPMPRIERPGSDIYMLYTGGTTGMPKGVMYPIGGFTARMGLGFALRGVEPPTRIEDLPEKVREVQAIESNCVSLPACPLMHGTGMWLGHIITSHLCGTTVGISAKHFDADELWRVVERHSVTDVVIVGDAFAMPMLSALRTAQEQGRPYDISSIKRITSSGVMWSKEVKDQLLEFGDMMLWDAMGSTEGGMGNSITMRGAPIDTAKFELAEDACVFDENDQPVEPGSGEIGMVATSALVPIGYYKDETKSAATFREIDGVRYSFPGDYAMVEADGTLTLLGRGSNCINTGGEKVFPEEVEEAIKRHPEIEDCLVVGLDDERFGQKVIGVASRHSETEVSESDLIAYTRHHLSGYKLPKQVIFVDRVRRAVNGKADYAWAKSTALEAVGLDT